jgi:hypothetical protein
LRLAEHGDRRKMNAAFMAAIAERNEVIVAQREQLDEMAEDRDAWRQRALAAEARLRRPSLLAGWWALLAMGWVGFWDRFETPESRRGIAR